MYNSFFLNNDHDLRNLKKQYKHLSSSRILDIISFSISFFLYQTDPKHLNYLILLKSYLRLNRNLFLYYFVFLQPCIQFCYYLYKFYLIYNFSSQNNVDNLSHDFSMSTKSFIYTNNSIGNYCNFTIFF